ncbi:MAG: CvpA family protein [Lachnospiraceae bacterium]|nr:CvpA family protein [Lachnospiraceae bacterium]
MDIWHIGGLLLIAICAIRGCKKGFVNTLGEMLAAVFSIAFVYLLHTWAFDALFLTLLKDHTVVIVRVLLCVILYVVLYFVLKAIILSLRIFTGLPIVRGLNKLLGFAVGIVYGIVLVGIIFAFFPFLLKGY